MTGLEVFGAVMVGAFAMFGVLTLIVIVWAVAQAAMTADDVEPKDGSIPSRPRWRRGGARQNAAPVSYKEEDDDDEPRSAARHPFMAFVDDDDRPRFKLERVAYEDLTPEQRAELDAQVFEDLKRQAQRAVAETGLTGEAAEKLYSGILAGIARAKERGVTEGHVAVSIDPPDRGTGVPAPSPHLKVHELTRSALRAAKKPDVS